MTTRSFAHYVRKEKIVESAVTGTPVIALCGKVWVPNRDPGRFPVCPECKEIFEGLPPGGGDGDAVDARPRSRATTPRLLTRRACSRTATGPCSRAWSRSSC